MASANGKCFIVVGAGNGLGYAISKRLLGSGARVVISSRTRENLEKLKERLSKFGRVDYVAGDATKSEDAKRVASEAKRIMGRIDGAAIQVGDFLGDNFESFNADNAYKMVSANLVAPLIAVQAMSGAMERGAAVVFISNSEAAQTKKTSTNLSYLVSKAALNKAVEMVAAELLPRGIRANGI
ncbi:MAG: SDR family NAD(P)-dependent oxidoreductase, partial [Candidatus Marsarchaeota archaeon]|nr:SDR family NAD(P)-dependent oxidoreductase [Candidatus Marsarchaeota archaeon]